MKSFRKTLADELSAIVDSREIDGDLIQMQYVEKKREALGELLDYYTDDLITYKPFADEFDPMEIEALREFLGFIRSTIQLRKPWSEVQAQARNTLTQLRSQGVWKSC